MTKTFNTILLIGVVLLCGSAVSARAADLLFDFNSLTSGSNASAIAIYMDNVLGGACAINHNCVTVTGAVADRTYNGENHVVGPSGNSLTLGNTDGALDNAGTGATTTSTRTDTFISNITDGSSQISSQMIITFSHGVVLNGSAGFDYEIFPDNTCATKYTCGNPLNPPDFTFAENGKTGNPIFTTFGVFPGSGDGSETHSPHSGTGSTEGAAQYIGHWSGTFTNVTALDFIDWPAAIGVDNIYVGPPEPRGEAMFLGGLLLAVFAGKKLRRAFAKS